jgi:hypothetical protein
MCCACRVVFPCPGQAGGYYFGMSNTWALVTSMPWPGLDGISGSSRVCRAMEALGTARHGTYIHTRIVPFVAFCRITVTRHFLTCIWMRGLVGALLHQRTSCRFTDASIVSSSYSFLVLSANGYASADKWECWNIEYDC